jgi:hypothetical protein
VECGSGASGAAAFILYRAAGTAKLLGESRLPKAVAGSRCSPRAPTAESWIGVAKLVRDFARKSLQIVGDLRWHDVCRAVGKRASNPQSSQGHLHRLNLLPGGGILEFVTAAEAKPDASPVANILSHLSQVSPPSHFRLLCWG